eukprot:TRINITY_DN4022_c0_g1_i1.p1 TRINITY_DN4022_c0_g1~~TRINITY_DN4022_c0_g1_i1.p1  ORF type:complete len:578 (+),score=173.31 TRINITY_DN4022_c0_g1_i1:65-1735(+)
MNPAEGDADQGENLTAEEEAEVRRRVELEKLKRKEQVQKRRDELRQKSSAEAGLKTKEGLPVVKPLAQAPPQQYAASEYDAPQPAQLREDLISNAIPFLTNPRVVNSPEDRKRKFLQFKGLNDAEIDEAMIRAGQTPASRGGQSQSAARPAGQQQYQQQQGYQQTNGMVRYQQPGPYGPPPQLPPPPPQQIQLVTPWKTIVFVALLCTGLGNALVYFLRRLWRRFFGKPQVNKEDQLEKLKQNMEFVVEKINSQEKDVKDAMDVLKTYLETSVENEENKKRVMDLQKRQESAKVSDLRRDIDYIKKMLPAVSVQEFHSEFLDEYGDIKSEMTGLKQQLHRSSTNGKDKYEQYRYGTSSTGPGTNPAGAAKEPTMPWLRSSSSTSVQQSSSAPVPVPVPNANANADKKRLPDWLTNSTGPSIPEWQRTATAGNTPGSAQQNGSGPTSSNGSPASSSPLNTNNNNGNSNLGDSENNSNHMNNFTSSDGSENIPYSQNFMDIVKMVQNGQTPPNVRTDIVDKPEDPEKPFDVQGELSKKPKPWERKQATGAPEDESKSE